MADGTHTRVLRARETVMGTGGRRNSLSRKHFFAVKNYAFYGFSPVCNYHYFHEYGDNIRNGRRDKKLL